MFEPLEPVERVIRLDGDDLDLGIVLFESSTGAHNRAGGADAGGEVRDAAVQSLGTFCDRSKTSGVTTITDVARKTFAATTDDKFTACLLYTSDAADECVNV